MSHIVPTPVRASMRHAIALPCQVVRELDFSLIGSRTLDVSPSGMLVATGREVAIGDKLIVSFKAPDGCGLWFDAEATIRRIEHGRRPTDKWRAIGLEFETLSRVSRLILRGGLRRVPPPLPRRPRWTQAARLSLAT